MRIPVPAPPARAAGTGVDVHQAALPGPPYHAGTRTGPAVPWNQDRLPDETMTKDFPQIARSVSSSLRPLRRDTPALIAAFNALGDAAMKAGALDAKTKELIALALGVAARCDPCLAFHAKALVALDARREEVEEAVGVAVYMGGGPSLMYAGEALDAFAQFSAAAEAAA